VQQLHSATLRARAPVGGVEGSQSGEVIEGIEVAGGDLGLIECLCGVFPRPHRLRHILDRVPGVVFRITNHAYADVELCIDLDAAHEVRPCLWSETLRFLRRKVHSKHAK
jgi:hypothetical protein